MTTARRTLRKADGTAPEATDVARKKPPAGGAGAHGEGSRGGHVVGHAPGGAPEYERAPRFAEQIASGQKPGLGPVGAPRGGLTGVSYAPAGAQPQGSNVNNTISKHAPTPDSKSAEAEKASAAAQSANHPDAELAAAKAHEAAAAAQHGDANKIEAKHHAQMAVMHRRMAAVMQAQQAPSANAPTRVSKVGAAPSPAGTVAGRGQTTPEQRGQSASSGGERLMEPAGGGEQSKQIADEHLKSKSAGTTSQGTEAKLGASYDKMKPEEVHEVAKLHRGAQEHLLNAAEQTGDAKYKEAAKKHLDEEFKASTAFVHHQGGQGASLGKPMEKSLRSKFRPVAGWIYAPETLAKSAWHAGLDPLDALGMLDSMLDLEKARKPDPRQGDIFGGAEPESNPEKAPSAAGHVHNEATQVAARAQAGHHGGGEGSRGGHVIGHTRSNKPIYESHSNPAHAGFTSQDHADAAKKHKDIANDLEGPVEDVAGHDEEHHRAQAKAHEATGEALHAEEAHALATQHSRRAIEASRTANFGTGEGGGGTAGSHLSARGMHLQAAASMRAIGRHDLAATHDQTAKQHEAKHKDAEEKTRAAEQASLRANSSLHGSPAEHLRAASAHHAAAAAHTVSEIKRTHFLIAKGHEEAAAGKSVAEVVKNRVEAIPKGKQPGKRRKGSVGIERSQPPEKDDDVTITNPGRHPAEPPQHLVDEMKAKRKESASKDAEAATKAAHTKTGSADEVGAVHKHAAELHTKAAHEHNDNAALKQYHEQTAARHTRAHESFSSDPFAKQAKAKPNDHEAKVFAEASVEGQQQAHREGHRHWSEDVEASNKEHEAKYPGSTAAGKASAVHDSIQNFRVPKAASMRERGKTLDEHAQSFRHFESAIGEHHNAVKGGNMPALQAARAASDSAREYQQYARGGGASGEKAAAFHLKEARQHAKRAMTLARNHRTYKKSLVDEMNDLAKAFTPSTSAGTAYKPRPQKKAKKTRFELKKPSKMLQGTPEPHRTGGNPRASQPAGFGRTNNVAKSTSAIQPIDAMIETLEKSMTHGNHVAPAPIPRIKTKKGKKPKHGKTAHPEGGAQSPGGGHTVSPAPHKGPARWPDAGHPHPGATTHLNPQSAQGSLTKSASSMDNFSAAYAAEGVDDRYRHRPRLQRPMQAEIYVGDLPKHSAPEARPQLEKSEAVKLASLAIDHALRDSWRVCAAQQNQGSPAADVLLKSASPNGRPAWSPEQRAVLNPTFIEPDSLRVVQHAASLLKGLAAVDPDAALGLGELAVSEATLMDRFGEMNLNFDNVVFT